MLSIGSGWIMALGLLSRARFSVGDSPHRSPRGVKRAEWSGCPRGHCGRFLVAGFSGAAYGGFGVDAGSSTGLRLEVDASGKLVPALPSPGLVAEERACGPDADTCAGPTRAGAWDRPRALARDLGIVALFAGGLLALARAIRRLS